MRIDYYFFTKYIQAPDMTWNKPFKTEKYDAWMAEQLKFYFGTFSRFVITKQNELTTC